MEQRHSQGGHGQHRGERHGGAEANGPPAVREELHLGETPSGLEELRQPHTRLPPIIGQ